MSSVVCWKIPNCNSHHSTSFQNKAKCFSFLSCKRSFHYVTMNLSQFVCTPFFPRMQGVSLNISHVSNYTLPAGIFSHLCVCQDCNCISSGSGVLYNHRPSLWNNHRSDKGGGGSQYLCCLSKTQSRVKSTTGKSLCHHSLFIFVVKNISVWGPFFKIYITS